MTSQSNVRQAALALTLALSATSALADFVIEYPSQVATAPITTVPIATASTRSDAVLLLDNSYRYLIEYGDKGETGAVVGSVKNMPLAGALNLLIPDDWKISADKNVALGDVKLDWVDGQMWTQVLEQAGRDNHLVFEVDWDRQEIMISNGGNIGLFAGNFDNRIPLSLNEASKPDAPLHTFTIRKGDNLRNVVTRMANAYGFSRALVDIKPGTEAPIYSVSEERAEIKGHSIVELGKALSEHFAGLDDFGLITAQDRESRALVLSNYQYNPWDELRVFEVQPGNLQHNAVELAEFYGWSMPSNYWQSDVSYEVKVRYAIVAKNVIHGFTRLFEPYPLQARLIDSTKQVVVVKRNPVKRR